MKLPVFKNDRWDVGSPIWVAGSLWFKARAVGTSLQYANPLQAVRRYVSGCCKKTFSELSLLADGCADCLGESITLSSNQQPHEVYINEFGLQRLVWCSNKLSAKGLVAWVMSSKDCLLSPAGGASPPGGSHFVGSLRCT